MLTIGQSYTSIKSGFTGIIQEVVPNGATLNRVRLMNDEGIEKWTMAVA